MIFLIRIFPEIAIKSRPVRKQLTQRLCSNIGLALNKIDHRVHVKSLWDKIKISTDSTDPTILQQLISKLQQIPGIQNFAIVETHSLKDIDSIFKTVLPVYETLLDKKSFAVRVKRVGTHQFSSLEVEREIGRRLLESVKTSSVNLKQPDITVQIEIKDDKFYLFRRQYVGVNGYPVGSQGKVLSLISGGYDSAVSSFLMMQKGCKVDYLFFNLGGYAHELGVKEVSKYLTTSYSDGYGASFISVNFEPIIAELIEHTQPKYRGLILKRCMYRVAEKLSQLNEYKAIVTGESLGQVSSQTLINLNVINQVTNQLVIQPLITMNKIEIIKIAQQIGTEEFANQIPEYCGVVSQRPSTGAKLESVIHEESRFNFEILDSVFDQRQVIKINQFAIENSSELKIESTTFVDINDIVIDVRNPEDIEENPFTSQNTLEIPFYQLNGKFEKLDQNKTYLLYCDNGTTSKLLALNLIDKGYNNIKIYSA